MKFSNRLVIYVSISLVIWFGLFFCDFFILRSQGTLIKTVAKLVYIPHALILLTIFKIYHDADQDSRKILLWLVIANIGLFLNDISWYFVTYFHFNITHVSLSSFLLNLIPFFIWVMALIIFSAKILNLYVLQIRYRIKTLFVVFFINCSIILLFLSSINYAVEIFSWSTIAEVSTFITQIILLDFVILCLIYTESKGLSTFLAGVVILVAGDFFIIYSIIAQTTNLYYYGELLWFLGLLLNLFGILMIRHDGNYKIGSWVRKDNTIKSKLIFWCFSTAIISFLLFFIIAYAFSIISKTVFLGMPLFIMIYSIIVIVLLGVTYN